MSKAKAPGIHSLGASADDEYRRLFELSLDLLCLAGTDGYFKLVNPAFQRTLGYTSDELLAVPFFDFVFEEDQAQTTEALNRLGEGHDVIDFENRYRCKDGSYRWLSWRAVPSGDSIYAVARDITDRKRLEEQLSQTHKMEAIGRLAGGLAHDFNNLLTTITGYAQITLRELPADDPLQELLEEILKSGERAATLTEQLLAFGHRQSIRPRALDLNRVVEDMAKMLRRLIGVKIELSTTLDPALHAIEADPNQVALVILNLAINAKDAMPSGGELSISTVNMTVTPDATELQPTLPPGSYAVIKVSDTGSGMTAETKARIFEPFFTTKERGRGTGLGLATTYGIVNQSGGHIWCSSALGRGTTLTICLPATDKPIEDQPHGAQRFPSQRRPPRRGPETILVVEDEEAVRKLAVRVLERCGHTVLDAASGEEALAISAGYGQEIDLLVSDVVMPGMDGPQLAQELGKSRTRTRVLLMSGYTDRPVAPGMPFLRKPFSPESLAGKVREVLDRRPTPDG